MILLLHFLKKRGGGGLALCRNLCRINCVQSATENLIDFSKNNNFIVNVNDFGY